MSDYVISVRGTQNGAFTADVGPTQFLTVPDGQIPSPADNGPAAAWYQAAQAAGEWTNAAGAQRGDILIVVHGYNNSEAEVIDRHRRIKFGLSALGFFGVVISFDWPCEANALAYLSDRHKAKLTAFQLVTDGVSYLSRQQIPNCPINVHLMGHSTGAYVIREAFDDADDTQLPNSGWTVSQIIFAAGDVSSASMSAGDSAAASIYRHSVRVTNYSNRHDEVLDLSNVKRVGLAPRVGRKGLPGDAPSTAVNVDCSAYYESLDTNAGIQAVDQPNGRVGVPSHSWYFGNRIFAQDLFDTIIGIDRQSMKTRGLQANGALVLQR